MNYLFAVSIIIFIGTLLMVILKPKNIPIGYSALIGGALTYAVGIINFGDVARVIELVWNATFTFVSIIILSLVLDEAGVFEYAAIKIARFSRGNGLYLFVMIILLGAGISAIFANDGTALILTPIVYLLLYRSKLDRKAIIPYIMATGFIADSSSMPLIISNLVNILSAGYFNISFLDYALKMILPDLVSIVASLFFLYLYYRKDIPHSFDLSNMVDERTVIKDNVIFKISLPLIIALLVAYSISGIYSLPVAIVAVPSSVMLLIYAGLHGKVNVIKPLKDAPWQIVLFSIGMYLVVFGMGSEGLTAALAGVIQGTAWVIAPLHILISGLLFGAIAGMMNNLPSVMLGNLALGTIHNPGNLVYANVIGNDIGPKFTPIGSLATLVWLHTLDKKSGIKISTLSYMKMGAIIGIPVLALTLLTLSL